MALQFIEGSFIHNISVYGREKSVYKFQGRKNACIFLTPDHALLTFLQGFEEELDWDYHKKQAKYVWNMLI